MNEKIKERIDMIDRGEVPEGYKKTGVGIIPEEWEVEKLGVITDVRDGTHDSPKYLKSGIPFITAKNLVNGKIDWEDINYISEEDHIHFSKRSKVEDGDILFGMIGTIGNPTIVEKEFEFSIKNVALIKFREALVNNYYIYNLLMSDIIEKQFYRKSNSGVQRFIGLGMIRDLDIPTPLLQVQQKIAQILSTWDKAIGLKEKLIEEKEEQKKGLMQRLLTGEVRLPGFEGEWEEVRLGDIGEIVTGTTPSTRRREYYENGTYPWITPTDISDSKYISKPERYLTKQGLEAGRYVPAGSLLITCIASIGKNAIITQEGSCNQQINAIFPSEDNVIEFLYYLIGYKKNYLEAHAGAGATSILNKSTFENLKFVLPPIQEQKSIAQILSTADKEIDLLTQELEQLKEQKKGLMQLLLTGKIRVPLQ